ncbi:hypothetical protein LTR09_006428 [Extremus antarcticus]|uniref:Uncharacterized protein n=1 Tax=Extremus antarcticus TaxID=702011 RepID=A0AAJ0G7W8_9PEZI|nr:hypothetical protein LTR09_006428 [Extremus antarcticus]
MATANSTKRKADDALGGDTKKLKSNYGRVIPVIIGTATFMVHEDLLHLGVPAATIPQGAPVVVHVGPQIILEGHLASTFVLYLDCLYSASHDFRIMDENLKKNCTKSIYMIRICECYIRLWLLGDHFKDNTFKNKVMNKLIGETSTGRMFIFRSQITMREKVLQIWSATSHSCHMAGFEGFAMRRIVEKIKNGGHLGIPRLEDAGQYHCHEQGEGECI